MACAPTSTTADLARLGLRHDALNSALRDQASRHLRLTSLLEQLPEPENRVMPDPDASDMYGVPLFVFPIVLATTSKRGSPPLAMPITRSPRSGRPRSSIGTPLRAPDISWALHAWAATSVVDHGLRSHDHPNLFIVGSAVFQ